MGSAHVMVDRDRTAVPITATRIRAKPQQHLDWLDPQVRAHFVARVCILGAESTGKTTLAQDLADHYRVAFVPEFGRLYTEAMPDPPTHTWSSEDFRRIAETQAALEDDAARWSGPPVICDTNTFVTAVFHEAYLGSRDPGLEAKALKRRYDLFVICDPQTPFEQDSTGLRVDGERRKWMHHRYVEYAEQQPAPVVHARGTRAERLAQSMTA